MILICLSQYQQNSFYGLAFQDSIAFGDEEKNKVLIHKNCIAIQKDDPNNNIYRL